jgi:hypothetical protein
MSSQAPLVQCRCAVAEFDIRSRRAVDVRASAWRPLDPPRWVFVDEPLFFRPAEEGAVGGDDVRPAAGARSTAVVADVLA